MLNKIKKKNTKKYALSYINSRIPKSIHSHHHGLLRIHIRPHISFIDAVSNSEMGLILCF